MNHWVIGILVYVGIGGFIGWITNFIAIKALFRPYEKKKFLGIEWQGLVPNRRKELANNLGNMVEGELINIPELINKVKKEDVDSFIEQQVDNHRDDIADTIRGYVEGFIKRNQSLVDKVESVGKVFGFNLQQRKEEGIKELAESASKEIKTKAKSVAPKLIATITDEIVKNISIHDITEEKINEMDLKNLEAMVHRIANREMKMIEYFGGILGGIVGAIQWTIQYFLL